MFKLLRNNSVTDCKENSLQVNFEEFCAIIAELKTGDSHNNNNNNGSSESEGHLCSFLINPLMRFVGRTTN